FGEVPADRLNVLRGRREHLPIGRRGGNIGGGVGVLAANRMAGLEPLAEALLEDAGDGGAAGIVACNGLQIGKGHQLSSVDGRSSTLSPYALWSSLSAACKWRGLCPAIRTRPRPKRQESAMANPAPFVSRVLEVEKDWIDYNGHMNIAYYNVLFDRCADEAFEVLGMGPKYAGERRL